MGWRAQVVHQNRVPGTGGGHDLREGCCVLTLLEPHPDLGTNYLKFEWIVPKVRLQF